VGSFLEPVIPTAVKSVPSGTVNANCLKLCKGTVPLPSVDMTVYVLPFFIAKGSGSVCAKSAALAKKNKTKINKYFRITFSFKYIQNPNRAIATPMFFNLFLL
jgi:hypothetical protein